ncbi:MAG: hypothetical protein U0Y10_04525 [Spirosomataceae bacterium]
MKGYLGSTYDLASPLSKDLLNNPYFYEIKFTPVYVYEKELGLSIEDKLKLLQNVITYLKERNINVTFTDRVYDDEKSWERQEGENWRYLPVAELQGNNICINPRNIDFLSIYLSIGHIYGHLVQRMDHEKYKPITDFLDYPKPLDLNLVLSEYRMKFGGNYKDDFLKFEIEAFQYAKYAFIKAGNEFNELMDYAMNVYIETDFNELWRWVTVSNQKSGPSFMDEFQKLWYNNRGKYTVISPKEVEVNVVADPEGSLIVVRGNF